MFFSGSEAAEQLARERFESGRQQMTRFLGTCLEAIYTYLNLDQVGAPAPSSPVFRNTTCFVVGGQQACRQPIAESSARADD